MTIRQQNSMAAFLSLLMLAIIWLAVIAGVIAFLLLAIGLLGSLSAVF